MGRRSDRSWWGGLYGRLLTRGFDPATAKLVARHVRADMAPFLERVLAAENARTAVIEELLGEET